MSEKTGTEITTLPEKAELPEYFNRDGGIESVVKFIEAETRKEVFDYTTAKGRKHARSVAAKVSSSKTLIDGVGKDLTEGWRAKTKKVNDLRKLATTRLDELRDEIKKPAEEAEAKEAERVKTHMLALDKFDLAKLSHQNSGAELSAHIEAIEEVEIGPAWEEYEAEARENKARALDHYRAELKIAQAREAEQAELEQLRREKAERDEKEAAERAAEKERKAVEEAERARLEAEERAAREAEEAAKRYAKEAEERAAREKAEADERHRQELEEAKARELEAAAAERERIAAEKKAAEEAEAQRKADAEHRKAITAEVVAAITNLKPAGWEPLVAAMIDGKIPHVKVMV